MVSDKSAAIRQIDFDLDILVSCGVGVRRHGRKSRSQTSSELEFSVIVSKFVNGTKYV